MDLLWTLNDGKNRRIFLGLNFSIPQFSGVGKFGKYFLGWVDNLKVPPYVDRVILFVFVVVVIVFLPGERGVMYRSNRSFNMLPPPRAYPGHLTPLLSRGGGNLIINVFQGVGNLIPSLRVGNLNCTLDWRGELSWGTRCQRIFVEKIVPFWPIGYEERA